MASRDDRELLEVILFGEEWSYWDLDDPYKLSTLGFTIKRNYDGKISKVTIIQAPDTHRLVKHPICSESCVRAEIVLATSLCKKSRRQLDCYCQRQISVYFYLRERIIYLPCYPVCYDRLSYPPSQNPTALCECEKTGRIEVKKLKFD